MSIAGTSGCSPKLNPSAKGLKGILQDNYGTLFEHNCVNAVVNLSKCQAGFLLQPD